MINSICCCHAVENGGGREEKVRRVDGRPWRSRGAEIAAAS